MLENRKAFLESVTSRPGVYQMLDQNDHILYIGKAKNLKKRLSSYFSSRAKDLKTEKLLARVANITVTVTHTETEALLLECNLIKKHQPHYNILFRDDKSYPYIRISDEKPYPCIEIYRGRKTQKGRFFGPYPSGLAVRDTIHMIQKLFRLRMCHDRYDPKRVRPCLQYQIGLCSGACAGVITEDDYQHDVQNAILFLQGKNEHVLMNLTHQMEKAAEAKQYELAANCRDQISQLRTMQAEQVTDVHTGNVDVIGLAMRAGRVCLQWLVIRQGRMLGSRHYFPAIPLGASTDDILTSFIIQHYLGHTKDQLDFPSEIVLAHPISDAKGLAMALSEWTGHRIVLSHRVRQSRKKWLTIANQSAVQALKSELLNKSSLQQRFFELKTVLQLKQAPKRIECYDISHTRGEATMASCVVFTQEGPQKNEYRRFNITGITPGDDCAAMSQVILRRFKGLLLKEAVLPDMILIDGGPIQLKAALSAMDVLDIAQKSMTLVAVSKGVARKPGLEVLHRVSHPPMQLPADSLALHLIQSIRDEAHRFAIMGHRQQRDKKRQTSILEEIEGVGPKRRRTLLRYFGGIQAIHRASLDELSKVPGINTSLAKRIFLALHGEMN